MDITIKILHKEFLNDNILSFLEILKDEPSEYWQESNFKKELPGKFETSLIAIYENSLVGYIISSIKETEIHIHKYMISDKYRGKGVGTMLLKEFENNLSNKSLKTISLTVQCSNYYAINFYFKQGFKIESIREDKVTSQILFKMFKKI